MDIFAPGVVRCIRIADPSAVGQARREAQQLAAACTLDDTGVGRAAIVASELATNLVKHAEGGEMVLQLITGGRGGFIEMCAIDSGPGMADPQRACHDGFSTTGTLGGGLGAVRRLSDTFDMYSEPGQGTVVMSRLGADAQARFGALSIEKPGEQECGDGWRVALSGTGFSVMVADGLGHGALAAGAARAAAETFERAPWEAPKDLILRMHDAMRGTRGGAVACAIRTDTCLSYAGVGNIAASLLSGTRNQGLVSHNGTVGSRTVRVQQFDYPVQPGATLFMYSDGISSRWQINRWPGLVQRHPAVIAAVLYRDCRRSNDDATVVVIAG